MAIEKGTNFTLYVATGTGAGTNASTFANVPGQEQTDLAFSGETVDTTDKSQAGWESKFRATRRATITISGFAVWPSTNGVRRMWSQFTADPPEIYCRVREAGSDDITAASLANADYYHGKFQISEMNMNAGAKDVTRFSATLESVGVVTYVT